MEEVPEAFPGCGACWWIEALFEGDHGDVLVRQPRSYCPSAVLTIGFYIGLEVFDEDCLQRILHHRRQLVRAQTSIMVQREADGLFCVETSW